MVSILHRNKDKVFWDRVNDVLCQLKAKHRYNGKDIDIIEIARDYAEIKGKNIKLLQGLSDDDVSFAILETSKYESKAIMKAPPYSIGVAIVENDNMANFVVVYGYQYTGAKHKIFA